MIITNLADVSLPLAVWAVHDEYDYQSDENYISATALMKPLRHIVLASRVAPEDRTPDDVLDYVARAMGHAFHDSIEKAWLRGYMSNLLKLGYPPEVIARVRVNPTDEEVANTPDCIPVYLEQREKKRFGKYIIGGKYDMVAEGIVQDYKSTSTFSWVKGTRDFDFALQGSLYRWLNPDKITEDFIRINFIFTDWQKFQVKANPNYPTHRVMHKDIPLLSIAETEAWIGNKLAMIEKYQDAPENEVPECTDEELWLSEPKFKYFSDPTKTAGRSTRNFDTIVEANMFKAEKAGKGIVITERGEPKRCGYCNAFSACKQKDRYFS